MKKKLYLALFIITAIFISSISYVFAANSTAVQDIRNVVGGAENVVEDVGKGVAGGIRNITAGGENVMENATHTNANNSTSNKTTGTATSNNNNYTATRTTTRSAANTTNGNFLGMNSTVWTWIIMAIVGIAIVALVWMYAKQNTHNSYDE